jgi:exonuclease III
LSPGLKPARRSAPQIYKESRFSDHAPLIMDYEL